MFDAVSTPLETGVVIGRQAESTANNSFTPLPKGLRETITQAPEFKPPSVTKAPSYEEPSIASLAIAPQQGQGDYIKELTNELKQMAQQQGLEPEEQITSEDSLTEHPLKKMSISQRIKNFFKNLFR